MTGAVDRRRAAFMVATDTCARSMMTPRRFISFTTLCADTGLRGREGCTGHSVCTPGVHRSPPHTPHESQHGGRDIWERSPRWPGVRGLFNGWKMPSRSSGYPPWDGPGAPGYR